MRNKKGEISIVLLVLMTLVLVGATLFVFNINLGKFKTKITNVRVLEEVYVVENQINFYINEIMEETLKNNKNNKKDFIDNFKQGLGKYKIGEEYLIKELSQVEDQADNIIVEENSVFFDLRNVVIIRGFDGISITYSYSKRFEKDL